MTLETSWVEARDATHRPKGTGESHPQPPRMTQVEMTAELRLKTLASLDLSHGC